FLLYDTVASALRRAAEATPICVVLDDLHSADLSSLALLEHVARELRDAPVLLVGAHRAPEPDASSARALQRLARVAHVFELDGLVPAELADWLERDRGRRPGASEVTALHERTGGNPLFVSQLLAAGDAAGAPPRGVREEIGRQLERLSRRAREALVHAAALGRDFALAPLARACERKAAALLPALDDAVRNGIVTALPGAVGRYRFAHGLFAEVLLAELAPGARARLHARVGPGAAGGGGGDGTGDSPRRFAGRARRGDRPPLPARGARRRRRCGGRVVGARRAAGARPHGLRAGGGPLCERARRARADSGRASPPGRAPPARGGGARAGGRAPCPARA